MSTLTISPATPEHEPAIKALQREAVAWLATKDTDQWQPGAMPIRTQHRGAGGDSLDASIRRGEVYILHEGDRIIGTFTLDDHADTDFWNDSDDPDNALYVHRMIISRSHAGRGLGAHMLDWATTRAAHDGKRWLRLDAWRSNADLHRYYARRGFEHVRTVEAPHRKSGALFQRETGQHTGVSTQASTTTTA